MGSLTPNFGFYKPAPSEFVDVEAQLNNNWKLADSAVRRLLEYEYVPPTTVTPDVVDSVRYPRFYKPYSNSTVVYLNEVQAFYQDSFAFVSEWIPALQFFNTGYNTSPAGYTVAYRLIYNYGALTTSEVEWTGAFWKGGAPMDLLSSVTVVNAGVLPANITPKTSKYFHVHAGNSDLNYSVARIGIGSNGSIDFRRYGDNPSASAENRIDMSGIIYNVEVTG